MAVDAYIPDIDGIVTTEYIDGVPVGSPPFTVLPGQDIEYVVKIFNEGTEAVDSSRFVIPIPYTTSYVNGSAVGTINFTPTPSLNKIYYDPSLVANGSIV